jgi:hypothetical protein
MFAVGLEGFDLREGTIFDVVLTVKFYQNGKPYRSTDVSL